MSAAQVDLETDDVRKVPGDAAPIFVGLACWCNARYDKCIVQRSKRNTLGLQ
jgi:hypothetical protein